MKKYVTTQDCFLRGAFVPKGTDLTLSDKAAKYLAHVLSEKKVETGIGLTDRVVDEFVAHADKPVQHKKK